MCNEMSYNEQYKELFYSTFNQALAVAAANVADLWIDESDEDDSVIPTNKLFTPTGALGVAAPHVRPVEYVLQHKSKIIKEFQEEVRTQLEVQTKVPTCA